MSHVFLLGAGFSKAISHEMPLLKELSEQVLIRYNGADRISSNIRTMIEDNFEKALTFLASDNPWMAESDNLRHKALYLDLTHVIRGILSEKSRTATVWGLNSPPLWLEALITHWHTGRHSVLTLNYDTLIERVAGAVNWRGRATPIPTGELYSIPFTPAGQRETALVGHEPCETFKLFKLHGSINWFYSGRSSFFGEDIFYVPCMGGIDGVFDANEGRDPERQHWKNIRDKTALIIPPTLDKSVFLQHESLRSMWLQAGKAISQATKIICMGYSLPISDGTMASFLKSVAPPARIPLEIVDRDPLRDRFSEALGAKTYDMQQVFTGVDCIPEFVLKNCIPNEQDRVHVAGMTAWGRCLK